MRALWLASAFLLLGSAYCSAQDSGASPGSGTRELFEMAGVSEWLKARFSPIELRGLAHGDLKVERHYCGCFDHPHKHFPYAMLVLRTPRGDLIARPEGGDEMIRITPLAVRFGNRYCELEAEQSCHGSFAHPCDFADFRYAPTLAAFFPTCMTDESEIAASIASERRAFGP
jgi:hypothetical protein